MISTEIIFNRNNEANLDIPKLPWAHHSHNKKLINLSQILWSYGLEAG